MTTKSQVELVLPWKTIGRVVLVISLFYIAYKLQTLFIYLAFSILFSVALMPLVNKLQSWGLKKGSALTIAIAVIVALIVTVLAIAISALVGAIVEFVRDDFPNIINSLSNDTGLVGDIFSRVQPYVNRIDTGSILQNGISRGGGLIGGISSVAGSIVFIFFFTIYIVLEKDYILRVIKSLMPNKWHDEADSVIKHTVEAAGGYVRGQLITSFITGLVSYAILWALGVPNATALSIIIGFTDIIPVFGGLIGLIPAVFFALTESPLTALLLVVFMQAFSAINSNLIAPRVYGNSLNLSPFTVALASTAGLMLFGIPGILLALPVAAIAGRLIEQYRGVDILPE